MARIVTPRKSMLCICGAVLILVYWFGSTSFNRRIPQCIMVPSNQHFNLTFKPKVKVPTIQISTQVSKRKVSNMTYWEEISHYNVDDYGVPVERYLLSVSHLLSLPKHERARRLKEANIKTVLFYNHAYGSNTYNFNYDEDHKQGQLPYHMNNCKRRDCFCTGHRDLLPLDEFDAIVFHARPLQKSEIPRVRKPHQRYIFWLMESPSYLFGLNPKTWNGFFNWTHTYRRDSDFWEPWGMMKQTKPFPKDVDTLILDAKQNPILKSDKNLSVAWMVSNCRSMSGRESYARELNKYIKVNIYGKCGKHKCSRQTADKCWQHVERHYYFYLSAENSLCKDYITEKFFGAMKRNIIPIVFGGGRDTADYSSVAPKRSYIDTNDFSSPKDLSKYLLYLQENPQEYWSYFWWKPYYDIWMDRGRKAHCEICDYLHDPTSPTFVYTDLHQWYVKQAKCRSRYRPMYGI